MQLLMLLRPIGPALLFTLVPLVSLGFMIATRLALEGRVPLPGVFAEPLRHGGPRLRAQALLGVLYAVAVGAILWLTDAIGGAAFSALQQAVMDSKSTPETLAPLLADPSLQTGALLFFGLTSALAVPYWYAPALVHWGEQSAGKALFFSTMACWRNKGALAVYMLTWAGVIVLFALLSNILFALLGQPQGVLYAAAPASLLFSTVFYASLYFSFADSFAPEPEAS
ncbi:MAG TPA: BPSS1780 family membrane protein, partial [Albitalea sp.]|nr:BPSS1780 family membrane protein [Albitalea sp.]